MVMTAPASRPAGLTEAETADARFIADDQGVLLHATESMLQHLALPNEALTGVKLLELLEFVEPDEVFHAGGMFADRSTYADSIREGAHTVRMHPGGRAVVMRFDRVKVADGRRFIVGSVDADGDSGADERALHDQLAALMARTAPASADKISSGTGEAELRHFLNMSNDIMAVCDRNGMFVRVNATFNDRFGYHDAQLREMTFPDIVHPEDRARIRNSLKALLAQTGALSPIEDFEARILTHDVAVRWIEWRQKREGGFVYIVGRDVTEMKAQAEARARPGAVIVRGAGDRPYGPLALDGRQRRHHLFRRDLPYHRQGPRRVQADDRHHERHAAPPRSRPPDPVLPARDHRAQPLRHGIPRQPPERRVTHHPLRGPLRTGRRGRRHCPVRHHAGHYRAQAV